jgi:hypothetical protein
LKNVLLTEHFSLAELTVTDHRTLDNTPDPVALANLLRLAKFLELVKTVLGGKPIIVTSAYRSKAVNAACGSKETSQHRIGCAADFRVPGMTPNEVVLAVIASDLDYDQLIREYNAWTHLSITSVPPRKMALIIDKAGTRSFS